MGEIAQISALSPVERFRECFSQACDALATVSALDRQMTLCLEEMQRQNESPARMIAARTILADVRKVTATASRIVPPATESEAREEVARIA